LKHRVLIVIFIVIALATQTVPSIDAEFVPALITDKPQARGGHSIAFDSHNGVAVIFGGYTMDSGWQNLRDTWVYSYTENSWTRLTLTPSPSARSNHAMVYCNETNEIILFGGYGSSGNPTDTWSFSCETQTWSEVATATNPGVHHSLALAYDPQENAVILFGGFDDEGFETDDTWKFDCVTREWAELSPTTAPLARYGHVMVYDEVINKMVMTSGNTMSQGHQQDTWTLDVATSNWTELDPTGDPDRLKWPSMTYDSVNQKCILFGGQIGDTAVDRTWEYDALTNTWTRRYPSVAPEARINTGLAFDSINNVTLLFGGATVGIDPFNDTWSYSYESNVWTQMEESTTPSNGPGFDPLLLALALPIGASVVVVLAVIIKRRT
jgi:N-acetylneuraminic acid mutarotase